MRWLIGVGISTVLVMAGCRDRGGSGDDAGASDGGGRLVLPTNLPGPAAFAEVESAFVSRPLDYSCLGTRTRPMPGNPIDVRFELRDFQEDTEVPQAMVWLFAGNEIDDTCSPPACQMFTTNAMGNADVQLPANGWYAYRVLPKMGLSSNSTLLGVFQYNEPAPASSGMAVTGNSVSKATGDLIPAVLGISRTEGLATVAGQITDCAGNNVQNAVIAIYDSNGNYVVPGELNDAPHYHYFNGSAANNLPDQARESSSADGLYVAVQIPPGDGTRPSRVEAWANIDGTPTRVACESARIFADAVTILNMQPLRSDAPAGCR